MAVFIPFAGPVNATSDRGEDGIFLGQLERIQLIASIITAAIAYSKAGKSRKK